MSEKSLLDDICIEYYAKLAYYGIKIPPSFHNDRGNQHKN